MGVGRQVKQEVRSEGLSRLCTGPESGYWERHQDAQKPSSLRKQPWKSRHTAEEGSTSLTQDKPGAESQPYQS